MVGCTNTARSTPMASCNAFIASKVQSCGGWYSAFGLAVGYFLASPKTCRWVSQEFFGRRSVIVAFRSLQADIGLFDDRAPLGVLAFDVVGKLLGRAARRGHPYFGESLPANI